MMRWLIEYVVCAPINVVLRLSGTEQRLMLMFPVVMKGYIDRSVGRR